MTDKDPTVPAERNNIRRPFRVDFLLVVANDIEKGAVTDTFVLPYLGDEDPLSYSWGDFSLKTGERVTVALLSLRDETGAGAAQVMVSKAVEILRPSYLIMVGIAAGASTDERVVGLGDVVIPPLIHHGASGKDETLRIRPIQQPSALLLAAADRTQQIESWKTSLNYEISPTKQSTTVTTHFGELISADRMAVPDEAYVKENIKKYPRASAFEMEGGAIAYVLRSASDSMHPPGFLLVKAISDMVFSDGNVSISGLKREEREAANREERKNWRPFAAHAAAHFVWHLINNFNIGKLRTVFHDRIWNLQKRPRSVHYNSGCIGVFGAVEPEEYSELSAQILNELTGHDGKRAFFTVCAYSPTALWEAIAGSEDKDRDGVSLEDQYEFAKEKFHHFAQFAEYATRDRNSVRILVMDKRYPHEKEWNLFLFLNGNIKAPAEITSPSWERGVPCWVVDREKLRSMQPAVRFLTDYVILGGDILLDYYHESGMLIISELQRHNCRKYYTTLCEYFWRTHKNATSKFVPLHKKHAELLATFGLGSQG